MKAKEWNLIHTTYGKQLAISYLMRYDCENEMIRHVSKMKCINCYITQPALTDYERAVYGALCGNLTAMVGVCHSWEDHLWARYKALMSHILDKVSLASIATLRVTERKYARSQTKFEENREQQLIMWWVWLGSRNLIGSIAGWV